MQTINFNIRHWGVGTKITVFTFALVSIILTTLMLTISVSTSKLLEARSAESVEHELQGVNNMVDLFNTALRSEAGSFGRILATEFPDKFSLDTATTVDIGGKATPVLKNGESTLNLDFTIVDRFTAKTGATATIFAATGDDFIRVSTSVKKENGDRAVGTMLDRKHPGYALLREGKSYIGLATLFGKQYITQYDPLKNEAGAVIGILYVGVDISKDLKTLQDKISAIKIGETGYFYVLSAAPGKTYGDLVVHPQKQGENILDNKDGNGREYVKEMLEKKSGTIRYPWADLKENGALREKTVIYTYFPDWNWVIAGGVYSDEITQESKHLRNRSLLLGFGALVIFAVALYFLVRSNITRPLKQAQAAASQIAEGDLTVNLVVDSHDEIGHLLRAMNGISHNLSSVVGQVREGAEQIATASDEIATGNLDLSSRTEEQASSLEETASSMEELTATVRQNADNARQANQLARTASTVAVKGGEVVARVVDTMDEISGSSRKIVDIISVIDGIAFQTNILALNAAVEAARAGEQGRGFAVVAGEVRSLAQRSATAAKEIKALIDASVGAVDAGTKLVEQAGVTMGEVVDSVARVTDIMTEISAASEEQSLGIHQVNEAITQMDQVTQQNAALVEEAAAAAAALQEQAAQLAQAVRIFRLDDAGTTAAPIARQARLALR
jgi:methyl-accepting chemotaxis protein-2 (aspartate sensor receptor)